MEYNTWLADIELVDGKFQYAATARNKPAVMINHKPAVGEVEGYSPMDYLLFGVAGCMIMTVVNYLRDKRKKTVDAASVAANAQQRTEFPRYFETITLKLSFTSPDLTDEDVEEAVERAEENLCPASYMVRPKATIETEFEIKKS